MIKYNTTQPKLTLPEYGRHVHKMIEHCVSIEDREERTKCAYAIADLMNSIFGDNSNESERMEKIWDHINIMSDFKLDVDFPCQVMSKEEITFKPAPIPYQNNFNKFRHYGKNIQEMISIVSDMENCIEKDKLIFLIANQMKKQLVTQNPEMATDIRIFNDIREISRGKIAINPELYRLNDYIGVTNPDNGKKKKKK